MIAAQTRMLVTLAENATDALVDLLSMLRDELGGADLDEMLRLADKLSADVYCYRAARGWTGG